MDNRIIDVHIHNQRLDPAESEVRVIVTPSRLDDAVTVRGRFMGPNCAYASTIEVAYHLREISRGDGQIVLRAVIPEPCLWDPQRPFLYHGPLELFDHGPRVDQRSLHWGLRTMQLAAQDLRINGQSLTIRGTTHVPASDKEASALHDDGFNLLLVADALPAVLTRADQFGFCVVHRVLKPYADELRQALVHPSLLGLVFPLALVDQVQQLSTERGQRHRVGVELAAPPHRPLPPEIAFVICPYEALAALADLTLPRLVLVDALPEPKAARPAGLLGWIVGRCPDQ